MKKILLALLFVVMAGTIGWLLAHPKPDAAKLALVDQELAEARAEVQRLQAEVVSVQKSSAEQVALKANEKTAEVEAASASKEPFGRLSGEALLEMMKSPGMKEVIKQQQRSQFSLNYGRLMKQLGFNDEQKARFEDLLLKKQTDHHDRDRLAHVEHVLADQRWKLKSGERSEN